MRIFFVSSKLNYPKAARREKMQRPIPNPKVIGSRKPHVPVCGIPDDIILMRKQHAIIVASRAREEKRRKKRAQHEARMSRRTKKR